MNKPRTWLPVLLIITAVVASGCQSSVLPPPTPTPTFTAVPQPVDTGDGEGDPPAAVPAATDAIPEATPYDLTQLHATDPTTVNTASGRPMVLEFFAFW